MAEGKEAATEATSAGSRRRTGGAKAAADTTAQDGSVTATRSRAGANGSTKAVKQPPAGARKTASRAAKQPDLKKDLREFASARPQGWNHDDWLSFLESLEHRGHNISDREAIGVALEKERLHLALTGLKGIGPQKRQSLIEYYGNLWQLRHADPDEIARVGNLPRKDAERIKTDLR